MTDMWRARAALRGVQRAADRAFYGMPSEAVVEICRLAWEAVEMATGAADLLPSSRDLLLQVVRTSFKGEQRLRYDTFCGSDYSCLSQEP